MKVGAESPSGLLATRRRQFPSNVSFFAVRGFRPFRKSEKSKTQPETPPPDAPQAVRRRAFPTKFRNFKRRKSKIIADFPSTSRAEPQRFERQSPKPTPPKVGFLRFGNSANRTKRRKRGERLFSPRAFIISGTRRDCKLFKPFFPHFFLFFSRGA